MIGQRESHKMKRYVLRCFGMESTSCSTIANHRVTLVKKQAIRHKWRKKRSSSYMFYYEQQHGCHKWNMNCLHSWSSTRCLIRVVVVLFFFFLGFRYGIGEWCMSKYFCVYSHFWSPSDFTYECYNYLCWCYCIAFGNVGCGTNM